MRLLRDAWGRFTKAFASNPPSIEDEGSEDVQDRGAARRALEEAQERHERVDGIKREVKIVIRKYR